MLKAGDKVWLFINAIDQPPVEVRVVGEIVEQPGSFAMCSTNRTHIRREEQCYTEYPLALYEYSERLERHSKILADAAKKFKFQALGLHVLKVTR